MILSDEEVLKRLNSPMNLLNKLKTLSNGATRRENAMDLFIKPKHQEVIPQIPLAVPTPTNTQEPDKPATLDSLIQNHESQIQLGLAHNNSIDLLNNSINLLRTKLDDVKAERLPSVILAASKTIESIRRERADAFKSNREREVHYHFYTPEQRKVEDFEIIEVQ